jgi:acyl-coenzyme A thioesterase PaaI-like protein
MDALQDVYGRDTICFGCGPANARGLQIKSFVDGTDVVADFVPAEHHQAFPGVINGGIIGALFDCHMNWTAAYHLKGDGDALPVTVTAEYTVRLLRPTPGATTLHLRAGVTESEGNRATVAATLEADGKVCAEATGIFVAVDESHPAYHRW